MKNYLPLICMLLVFSGCGRLAPAPAIVTPGSGIPGLSIEEHPLAHEPEAEYSQLDFTEGSQQDNLGKHAAERALTFSLANMSCTMENSMGFCVKLGNDLLKASEVYSGGLFDKGKIILTLGEKNIYTIPVGDPSSIGALRGVWSYKGHWALETAYVKNIQSGNEIDSQPTGQITIDGKLLNKQEGYEEAFGFQTMHGKPFYFFKRDGVIGISYDGTEISLGYEEIPHYGCCSAGTFNPDMYQNMVAFLARKGSQWYYIEIGVFE
jgi:hypothetical protein